MNKLNIGSIKEEAAACRAAFKDVPVGALVVHCHHESLFEFLSEPAENRINYILSSKSEHEQAIRLHLFRPVNTKLLPKKLREAYAKWQEADAKLREAYAKLREAYAKLREADAKWQEADAKWQEADAKLREADAKLREAYAKWQEADAKLREADAKLQEAYAKWQEADAKKLHLRICKNCPWNEKQKTIFPKEAR